MERFYEGHDLDWNELGIGDKVTLRVGSLDQAKELRTRLKKQAGELLIGLRWYRPEPVIYLREREGTVGRWREEEYWHVGFMVTRRIIKDWQIKDDFPNQSTERADLNTTTLYDVANKS
jgi:hypothetical protein